jgi:hypothetical protein
MHQHSRLQDGLAALTAQSGTAEAAQLAVNGGHQFLQSGLIPGAPAHE